jgi:hypothetical protein
MRKGFTVKLSIDLIVREVVDDSLHEEMEGGGL